MSLENSPERLLHMGIPFFSIQVRKTMQSLNVVVSFKIVKK